MEEYLNKKDASSNPEIHYTSIFKIFRFWVKESYFHKIFESTVMKFLMRKC